MKTIRIHQFGGPEQLRLDEVPLPEPGPGQIRVRLEAIGVNYIDTYHRSGLYPVPLPYAVGQEGAGIVDAVGPDAARFRPGDRVAWAQAPGSYAEAALVAEERAVEVPAGLSPQQAAAVMLQGMTAHYLATSTFPLEPGRTCLVHAAAGGVGLLLVQIAKRRGARVLATVSTEEKALLAREAGADEVILYTRQDFQAQARRLTAGRGVDVVYDSVGASTFDKSLDSLAPLGMLVLFGQSSGRVPPFDPAALAAKGSLFLTRPTLGNYVADRAALERRAADLFAWVARGELRVRLGATFPLAAAADAHRALQGRQTTGKLLLAPR